VEPFNALLYGVYTQGVVWLWAVPLALAAALYVAPDLAGQPLYSRALAQWGLWGLAFLPGPVRRGWRVPRFPPGRRPWPQAWPSSP